MKQEERVLWFSSPYCSMSFPYYSWQVQQRLIALLDTSVLDAELPNYTVLDLQSISMVAWLPSYTVHYLPSKTYSQNDESLGLLSVPESESATWIMSPLNPLQFLLTENTINFATALIIRCINWLPSNNSLMLLLSPVCSPYKDLGPWNPHLYHV